MVVFLLSREIKLFSLFQIICVVAACLSSCAPSTKSYITWQNYPITFSAYIRADGFFSSQQDGIELDVNITAPYTGSITFLSPENLAGYTVSVNEGKADITYSDIITQLPNILSNQIMLFLSLFNLNEDDLISVTLTEYKGINTNQAIFSVYLPIEYSNADFTDKTPSAPRTGPDDNSDVNENPIKVGEVKIYIDSSNDIPVMFEASFGEKNLVINIEKFGIQE